MASPVNNLIFSFKKMIFAPVIVVGTGAVYCVFKYFFNCPACVDCPSDGFDEHGIDTEVGIPFRNYESTEHGNEVPYTSTSFDRTFYCKGEFELVPISKEQEEDTGEEGTTSPLPDILHLSGQESVDSYCKYLRRASLSARGPPVRRIDRTEVKGEVPNDERRVHFDGLTEVISFDEYDRY